MRRGLGAGSENVRGRIKSIKRNREGEKGGIRLGPFDAVFFTTHLIDFSTNNVACYV